MGSFRRLPPGRGLSSGLRLARSWCGVARLCCRVPRLQLGLISVLVQFCAAKNVAELVWR